MALEEMRQDQCQKARSVSDEEKKTMFRDLSKHDINNALTLPHMPLLDLKYGSYKMTPPGLLHTSVSGLVLYIFKSLSFQLPAENQRIYGILHC